MDCKLYAVRIFVRDWERACDFYENVVGLEPRFKEARLGWAEFDRERGEFRRQPDPAIYSLQTPWPAERVVVEKARFRGLDVARLIVHPARYNPASGEILLTHSFDVRIDFLGGAGPVILCVGSGAGIPGLPFKILDPEREGVLVEKVEVRRL